MLIRVICLFVVASVGTFCKTTLSCVDADTAIRDMIHGTIQESYPTTVFKELSIRSIGRPQPMDCDTLSFNPPPHIRLTSDLAIKLDFHRDGHHVKRVTHVYRFSGFAQALRAAETLSSGTKLTPSHYIIDTVSFDQMPDQLLSDIGDAPLRLRSHIRDGRIIEAWMIEPFPDIKKGDTIKTIVKNGHVTLTLNGEALEDGQIGHSMKLQLNDKIVIGSVSDEKTIIINNI